MPHHRPADWKLSGKSLCHVGAQRVLIALEEQHIAALHVAVKQVLLVEKTQTSAEHRDGSQEGTQYYVCVCVKQIIGFSSSRDL